MEGGGLIVFMEFSIFIGGLYSIPTFLVCNTTFYLIKTRLKSPVNIKMIFISIAVILLTVTNYLLCGKNCFDIHNDDSGIKSTIAYCLAVIIVSITCKIKLLTIQQKSTTKKPWDY